MGLKTLRDLVDSPLPRTPMIISGGVLPEAGALMLYGEAGCGKSMLTLHTAVCLVTGVKWFHWNTKQSCVLLKQVELPEPLFRDRVADFEQGVGGSLVSGFDMIFQDSEPFKLDTSYGLNHAINQVEVIRDKQPGFPITMIFDPVYKIASGHLSDQYDTTKLTDHLDILRFKHKISIIILHHNHKIRRNNEGKVIDEGQDAQSGSAFLQAWPDTILRMWGTKKKDRDAGLWINRLQWEKNRYAKYIPYDFTIKWDIESIQPDIHVSKTHNVTTDELSLKMENDSNDNEDNSWVDSDMGVT